MDHAAMVKVFFFFPLFLSLRLSSYWVFFHCVSSLVFISLFLFFSWYLISFSLSIYLLLSC